MAPGSPRRGRFLVRGRGGRIPLRERLLVLFSGQVADEPVQHGSRAAVSFCQIHESPAQDHLAPGIELALPGGFPVAQGLKPGLGLGVSLLGAFQFGLCQITAPCSANFFGLKLFLPAQPLARTRRPVKDKGALMQTLHLWFRDLRAISLRQGLSRWRTPSMPRASTWKSAPPLPNHHRPTSAVGSRPANSHQRLARYTTVWAGLPLASPLQARAPESLWLASGGLSSPLRPQRCQRAPRSGARASGEKTADPVVHVGAWAGGSSGARWHHEVA